MAGDVVVEAHGLEVAGGGAQAGLHAVPGFTDSAGRVGYELVMSGGAGSSATADLTATGTITAADVASTTTGTLVTGTPTAQSTVQVATADCSDYGLLITGTFVGTLLVERSIDGGTTWSVTSAFGGGVAAPVSSITAPGAFQGAAAASGQLRVRATAWTSGTATVYLRATNATGTVRVISASRNLPLTTVPAPARVAVVASTPVQLVAANPSREALIITNEVAATLFVLLGTGTPSATNYSFSVFAGGAPFALSGDLKWTGAVQLFSVGAGSVQAQELQA